MSRAGGRRGRHYSLGVERSSHRVTYQVGIMPMGTGNDLSRALGWGASCASVIVPKRRLGRLRRERVLFAYNYASVGVDAQVALDFHYARSQFLYNVGRGPLRRPGAARARVDSRRAGAAAAAGSRMGSEEVPAQSICDGKLEAPVWTRRAVPFYASIYAKDRVGW
ncbi:unnamed protein product [Leptidea sinapis]|uniref:DAGKc domain-containing protein n=1 Tax=Leptidea sinapis TaxID=189913 RepID=A0A5E4Q8S5_9NEOP|nr:unnamed protein product [Leptidea sinapis]